MKLLSGFLLILINFTSTVNAQYSGNYSYDDKCGLWRTDGTSSGKNDNNYDNLFSWQFVQTPTTAQIIDVFFIDSLFGWAGHTGNGCMRTTDSGFNWIVTIFNDTNFTTLYNGVYFINQNTGWAVGGAVQIRKTTNGGANWFKQYAPPVAGILRGIIFFDENTGYGIGSKNFPYQPFACKSTNGGTNWVELNVAFANAQELNDQFWFNESTGWICGYDVLLKTTNGGASFSNLYSNIPPSGNGHIALLGIYFVNDQTGWAANLEHNNIYKTTNGGVNWFFQQNPVSLNGWNQINDVRFITADSGWAAHGTPGTGAIMFTSNAGTNWVMDNTQYSWYDCLYMYQHSKAWCGGSSGRMWYSIISEPSGISGNNNNYPEEYILYQNYPNPFNATSNIKYQISKLSNVKIIVYDVTGKETAVLIDSELNPGSFEVTWDASDSPSGVYFYRLSAGDYSETKKMVLIK